jgi:hypothetical protein
MEVQAIRKILDYVTKHTAIDDYMRLVNELTETEELTMGTGHKKFDTESMYKKIMPSSNLSNLKPDDEIPAQKSVPADADAEESQAAIPCMRQNVMSYTCGKKMRW